MTEATTTTTLRPGQCYDWWRILMDLRMFMSMRAISEVTGIPLGTLAGHKNSGVEPKHTDGEQILRLWRQRMQGEPPVIMCQIRQSDRVRK
jgi:hypothetical protein